MADPVVDMPTTIIGMDEVMNSSEHEDNKKRSSDEASNNEACKPSKKAKPAKANANGGKKRGGKKLNSDALVKEEADTEGGDTNDAPLSPPATPVPKKGAKNAKTPNSATRKRATPKVETRAIPKSYEEAGEADRMLYKEKEQGTEWATIRAKWTEMTGEETQRTFLPNRYNKMKCNMMRLEPGHARRLLETRDRIDQDFESCKWGQYTSALNTAAGTNYQTDFIKKQIKELDASGGLAALSADEPEMEVEDSASAEDVKSEESSEEATVNADE